MTWLGRRRLHRRCNDYWHRGITDALSGQARSPLRLPGPERIAYDAGHAWARFQLDLNPALNAAAPGLIVTRISTETWALCLAEAQRP